MDVDNVKRAELLMDHYKDTFAILHGHWKARNRLFMYALILIALIALDSFSPGSLSALVGGYGREMLGLGADWTPPAFGVLDLLARFLLLCLVIQYYQRSILVDRQYTYIHGVEERLCRLMGGAYVTREGRSYFNTRGESPADEPAEGEGPVDAPPVDRPPTRPPDERPLFLRWVAPLYVYVFPVLLSVLAIWRAIAYDFAADEWVIGGLVVACSVAIALYSFFYMRWVKARK